VLSRPACVASALNESGRCQLQTSDITTGSLPTMRITATILCANDGKGCRMATARFMCDRFGRPHLSVVNDEFLIIEWSADRIVARTRYLNPMTQLIIHPKEKRVALIHYIVSFVGTQETTYEPVTVSYELK
jgi:hypothetical protein